MAEVSSGDVTVMVLSGRETEWLTAFLRDAVVAAVDGPINHQLYGMAMDLGAWPDGFVTCSSCDVVAEWSDDLWDDEVGVCPRCAEARR